MKIKVVSSSLEIFASNEVKEVYVPTTEGEVGILPGHVNLVSTLEIGELKIRMGKGDKEIILNGGILQVKDDEVLVLADEASLSDELVKEEIDEAIISAEKQMSGKLEPAELIQLEKRLRYERFKQNKLPS